MTIHRRLCRSGSWDPVCSIRVNVMHLSIRRQCLNLLAFTFPRRGWNFEKVALASVARRDQELDVSSCTRWTSIAGWIRTSRAEAQDYQRAAWEDPFRRDCIITMLRLRRRGWGAASTWGFCVYMQVYSEAASLSYTLKTFTFEND